MNDKEFLTNSNRSKSAIFSGLNNKKILKNHIEKNNNEELINKNVIKTEKEIEKKNPNKEPNQIKFEVKILNDLNEKNSFLNSIIHIIFQLDDVRDYILSTEFSCDFFSSTLFELRVVLEKYNSILDSKEILSDRVQTLDPRNLRRELAKLFHSEKKFQLKSNDDPVDLLFFFLNALHSFSTKAFSLKNNSHIICKPICNAHLSIWLNLVEQLECKCGAKSRPMKLDYNYFLTEISMKELINSINFTEKFDYKNKMLLFFKTLYNSGKYSLYLCPESQMKCKQNSVKRNIYLMNNPNYFIFSLSWKEINPKLLQICQSFLMINHFIVNKDFYEILEIENHDNFELIGMICYWATEYSTFLKKYDGSSSYWNFYNNMHITRIENWRDLIEKCLKLHLHPVLLLYKKLSKETKAFDAKCSIQPEDISELINYSNSFDEENDLIYKSEASEKGRLRPSNLRKFYDPELEKKLGILKDKFEIQKIKFKFKTDEDYKREFEEQIMKMEALKNEKELNQNRNEFEESDKKDKKNTKVDFIPDLAELEWECENEFCKNINNYLNYYCLKCRKINYNVKDLNIDNTNKRIKFSPIKRSNALMISNEELDKQDNDFFIENSEKKIEGNFSTLKSLDIRSDNLTEISYKTSKNSFRKSFLNFDCKNKSQKTLGATRIKVNESLTKSVNEFRENKRKKIDKSFIKEQKIEKNLSIKENILNEKNNKNSDIIYMNYQLIDYKEIKKQNSSCKINNNISNQSSGILKNNADINTYKSKYSLTNEFKSNSLSKKVTFNDNLKNELSSRINQMTISPETFSQYNLIDNSHSKEIFLSNINSNRKFNSTTLYKDKNVYNKNVAINLDNPRNINSMNFKSSNNLK